MSYSTAFQQALSDVLSIEGEYSDHPDDSGGRTRWGVTEKLAREYGYSGPMTAMPKSVAKRIYYRHFWRWMELDQVTAQASATAYELFDAGVNIGRRQTWRWLQRCLNALNRNERTYGDIRVDGWPGPETHRALTSYTGVRPKHGDNVLAAMINSLQGEHYVEITEAAPKNESFTFGWIKERVLRQHR